MPFLRKKYIFKTLFITLVAFFVILSNIKKAHAQDLDLLLLLDSSASMRISDPKKLRIGGAELLVELLKPGDRLGIMEFSADPKMIWDFQEFNSKQIPKIRETLNVELTDEGLYTDLLSPLLKAQEIFSKSKDNKNKSGKLSEKVIVLLSDGKMDPDPRRASAAVSMEKLLEGALPQLKKDEIKVFTVSFSEKADKQLLAGIATRTLGTSWYTPSADKLHESFAKLVLAIKKPQFLEMKDKGFRIDGNIEEATFYINRGDINKDDKEKKEITLKSPNGNRYTQEQKTALMRWHSNENFEIITIQQPDSGNWFVEGLPKVEGFATVLTKLKLATTWPTSLIAGEERILEIRLFNAKHPIELPNMTDIAKYNFKITPTDKISEPVISGDLKDDGTEGDAKARDGIFSYKIALPYDGEYKLNIAVTAPTFERQQTLFFRVKPRLISLKVIPETESILGTSGNIVDQSKGIEDFFQVKLSRELLGFKNLKVELLAIDRQDIEYRLPLIQLDYVFEVPAKALPHDGEYKLYANVESKEKRKTKIEGRSEEVEYLYLASKSQESAKTIVTISEENLLQKPKEPEKPKSFFLIYLGILFLANIGIGGFIYKLVNKIDVKDSSHTKAKFDYSIYEKALLELKSKAEAEEFDMQDVLLTSPEILMETIEEALEKMTDISSEESLDSKDKETTKENIEASNTDSTDEVEQEEENNKKEEEEDFT